jgi:hypothetical protein
MYFTRALTFFARASSTYIPGTVLIHGRVQIQTRAIWNDARPPFLRQGQSTKHKDDDGVCPSCRLTLQQIPYSLLE